MCFVYLYPHVVGCFFSVPLLVRVAQPVRGQVCLRYLRPTWVTWLFFCLRSRVAEWLPLGKANANEGFKVCSLLSLVLYPKRVHFASLKMSAEYWGSGRRTTLRRSITITWIVSH
jgi:hypothetical protein